MDPLPRILYHGSTAHLADAIEAHGLQPRAGRGPFLCGDPERARGYAVRASCLALAEAEADADHLDLAHLPPALLVVATVPTAALLPDPAHSGDHWLTDPSAAEVRCERFDPAPWIASPAEARKYAKLMLRARDLEDQFGSARRRGAEGRPPLADHPPARRERGPRYGNAAPTIARVNASPPSTGTRLG